MMKQYYHKGEIPHLYFYRDKSQNEVDLIEETSFDHLQIYEIKSAHTCHTTFFKGMDYFRKLYSDKVDGSCVLYDGNERQDLAYNGFCNFREVPY